MHILAVLEEMNYRDVLLSQYSMFASLFVPPISCTENYKDGNTPFKRSSIMQFSLGYKIGILIIFIVAHTISLYKFNCLYCMITSFFFLYSVIHL